MRAKAKPWMTRYAPAARPTFYFIGVTTSESSVMRVFPAWAEFLELDNAAIVGIDFPLHADPAAYREAVLIIRDDPMSLGALVTTHKIDLFKACRDLFDVIDPYAALMGETSCISKRKGKLVCHAKDPISSGLTIDGFLAPDHFARTRAEVFSMGAGGSTIAISWRLIGRERDANAPSRIIVSDRNESRLEEIRRVHAEVPTDVPLDYVLACTAGDNDAVVSNLNSGSLIINATGLGKDSPGSPLTDKAAVPMNGIVWDLNYRGDLIFLDQARAHESLRHLQIENGWTYFIYGWTQAIAEVFHIPLLTEGPRFDVLSRIATEASRG